MAKPKKLNLKNEKVVEETRRNVHEVVGDFYSSSEYNDFVTRFERRRDAYYLRHRTNQPKWRSKLHMATFFLACKALDAQFKASHRQEPFVHVGVADDSLADPDAAEKARIAHADLNYDLHAGRFRPVLNDLYWYTEICGVGVAREYIRSRQTVDTRRGRGADQFGFDMGVLEQSRIRREEFTATGVIHPLNFAHEVTKRGFHDSSWASVRFELPISEVYRMQDHPHYYQPGVKKVLEKLADGKYTGYSTDTETFYSERGDSSEGHRKGAVIVQEYSGTIRSKDNAGDQTLYYMLEVPAWNAVLRIGPSPFRSHPYWKMQPYPDPDGPYGVGPNDMILPINYWENSTVNRYIDFMNVMMKFQYLIQQDNIEGGFNMLLNGLPHGMVPVERDADFSATLQPVRQDLHGGNAVGNMIELIHKYKEQQGVSSNLRGKGSEQLNDTATGISLMAQREDEMTQMLLEGCDQGLRDGMNIKLQNRTDFFSEPTVAVVGEGAERMNIDHYPYELSGVKWAFDIKRALPDVEAGKHLNFLKILSFVDNALAKTGQSLPVEMVIDAAEKVGTAFGVDGVDKMMADLKSKVSHPQGGAPQGPGGPGGPPAPGPQGAGAPPALPGPPTEGLAGSMANVAQSLAS